MKRTKRNKKLYKKNVLKRIKWSNIAVLLIFIYSYYLLIQYIYKYVYMGMNMNYVSLYILYVIIVTFIISLLYIIDEQKRISNKRI